MTNEAERLVDLDQLAATIRAERNRRRWSRRELSQRSGVPESTLESYEAPTATMSLENAVKLADAFGLTLDDLAGRQVKTN